MKDLTRILYDLDQGNINSDEAEKRILALFSVSESAFKWDEDKVFDFINWYIDLHKLDFRYKLENKTIVESYKNGDKAYDWHSR